VLEGGYRLLAVGREGDDWNLGVELMFQSTSPPCKSFSPFCT
jgi:hypothetical protein